MVTCEQRSVINIGQMLTKAGCWDVLKDQLLIDSHINKGQFFIKLAKKKFCINLTRLKSTVN